MSLCFMNKPLQNFDLGGRYQKKINLLIIITSMNFSAVHLDGRLHLSPPNHVWTSMLNLADDVTMIKNTARQQLQH